MTIAASMKAKALVEFDRLAASRERQMRNALRRSGMSREEIDRRIEACGPTLAAERAKVGAMVTIELLQQRIPLEGYADGWE